ncbi:MAG: hypothetical protein LBE13_02750 [Bacteroidales bacterium]|jgi:hypothetical protein|nr:hypothetical protein [Bacteroidales bacterium]
MIFSKRITRSIGLISIFLIIMQSCGIRYFAGQGLLISLLLLCLNSSAFLFFNRKDWRFLLLAVFALNIVSVIQVSDIKYILYHILIVLNVVLLLVYYRHNRLDIVEDFYVNMRFFFWQALLSYAIYLAVPMIFFDFTVESGMTYKTFWGILNVGGKDVIRVTGLFWEPGVLQLFLNLYLFLSIVRKKVTWRKIFGVSLIVLATHSTTGYIVLFVNLCLFFLRKGKIQYVFVGIIFLACLYPIIKKNVTTKLEITSGYIRKRDAAMGLLLTSKKPLLGHGTCDILSDEMPAEIQKMEQLNLGSEYLIKYGYLTGGFTNGLLGIFVKYGIPIGLLLCIGFINSVFGEIKQDKYIFALLCIVSFVGEPITDTAFLFLVAFSTIIIKTNAGKRKRIKRYLYSNSNLQCCKNNSRLSGEH